MGDRYFYRGKRTDNGEWEEGCLLILDKCEYRIATSCLESADELLQVCSYSVDPSTICRCTGSNDKNGKLIWENDIANGSVKRGAAFYRCLVLWNECKARFDVKAKDCNFPMTIDSDDISICGLDYEVIGNKFDNPELLEVQE